MKTNVRTEIKPRRLDRASLEFIMDVAARQSVGLEERCARYRRRAAVLRTAAAACLLVVSVAWTDRATAAPTCYTEILADGNIGSKHICNAIDTMVHKQ